MKHSILGAACAGILITVSGTAQAVAISGHGTWEITLQGRDLDGFVHTSILLSMGHQIEVNRL